ncbi:hypothetical protein JKF63_06942 [Porcisia hertigi]|uniref:Uncharacterized protein n=1 Tax=Porcisia hertigi TaxID=2761500 RepID=A0A837AY79_9TRYP|nr:hypothetical protein JKF63_06942 [Porcisia hertigi]
MATVNSAAREVTSAPRAVETCSSASAQPLPTRARKAKRTAPSVKPQPALLRNPYGMERPRLVDALQANDSSGLHALKRGPNSSLHADVEMIMSQQGAAQYEACTRRLRVVRQERRALATMLESLKQQLEQSQTLLDGWRKKPKEPPATTQLMLDESREEALASQHGSPPRPEEGERMVRQLRALDRANDELRQRLEALEREKQHCLTVHNARLRRAAPAEVPSSARVYQHAAQVACDKSRSSTRSAALAQYAQTLSTRLKSAMGKQQALRRELALAMAKERGRTTARAYMQAHGFVPAHASVPSGSSATQASGEAGARHTTSHPCTHRQN